MACHPKLAESEETRERRMAGSTGLEPAASGVTGRRSNQLNYDPDTCVALAPCRRNSQVPKTVIITAGFD